MQYVGPWVMGCLVPLLASWTLTARAESPITGAAGGDTGERSQAVLLATRAEYPVTTGSPALVHGAESAPAREAGSRRSTERPRSTKSHPSRQDGRSSPGTGAAEDMPAEAERPVLMLTRLQGDEGSLEFPRNGVGSPRAPLAPANIVASENARGPRLQFIPSRPQQTATDRQSAAEPTTAEADDPLSMFIFETFAGPSFIAMALGRNDETIAKLQALSRSELSLDTLNELDPTQLSASDFVHTVSARGTTIGGAASLQLGYLSVGGRLSYSDYDRLSIMTLTGEMAFRAYTDPMEFYFGMGFGGGYLYKVSDLLAKQRDGLAMRVGFGVSFRLTEHVGLGAGVDAVGLFMAGQGISPLQLAQIGEDTDHPIGAQLPVHLDLSVVL